VNSIATPTPTQAPQETSWLTKVLPLATFAVGVGTTLVLGGVDYGHQKNALETQNLRVAELQKSNDELRKLLDQWRDAYSKNDAALLQAQNKLTAMQNDQCEAVRLVVNDLQDSIANAHQYSYSDEKKADLREMFKQQQVTLQACFAARK
jgi:hypothetical protein